MEREGGRRGREGGEREVSLRRERRREGWGGRMGWREGGGWQAEEWGGTGRE